MVVDVPTAGGGGSGSDISQSVLLPLSNLPLSRTATNS